MLDLTRDLDQWPVFSSPREARIHMRALYDEDRWLGQLWFPVLLVEKDTMEPICRPMASRWQMPFASSRGYGSLTLQHDLAELLVRRHARTGQMSIVYFLSDHDPSGFDLQRAWEVALDNFGAPVSKFVRIALTTEQVRDPDLDIARLGIAVKPSDSREERCVEEHGSVCWEADVLPAAVIEQALDDGIRSWRDGKRWQRRDADTNLQVGIGAVPVFNEDRHQLIFFRCITSKEMASRHESRLREERLIAVLPPQSKAAPAQDAALVNRKHQAAAVCRSTLARRPCS